MTIYWTANLQSGWSNLIMATNKIIFKWHFMWAWFENSHPFSAFICHFPVTEKRLYRQPMLSWIKSNYCTRLFSGFLVLFSLPFWTTPCWHKLQAAEKTERFSSTWDAKEKKWKSFEVHQLYLCTNFGQFRFVSLMTTDDDDWNESRLNWQVNSASTAHKCLSNLQIVIRAYRSMMQLCMGLNLNIAHKQSQHYDY